MWNSRSGTFFLLLLHSVVLALGSAQGPHQTSPWLTLSGNRPLVIARGGLSGLFPDSSGTAYDAAKQLSLPDVQLWCDVKLTKDGAGICVPSVMLDNSTNISSVLKNRDKVQLVNGVPTRGWFSVDFSLEELKENVFPRALKPCCECTVLHKQLLMRIFLCFQPVNQGVYSRTNRFDGIGSLILTVQELAITKPPGLWLNIQDDAFFTQHNLSMRSFILSVSKSVVASHISSPEVAFLRSIANRFKPETTKLVFRFLGQDEIEPSTKDTYGSLLKNLTFIKSFASGILVPKDYMWPVDTTLYLQPHTSVVADAHKEGLEVFASDFVNDLPLSYNYSYDPLSECLSFIDNGVFSVDGVLTDFPVTSSAAMDCFAHLGNNASVQEFTSKLTFFFHCTDYPGKPLVISKYGASGDYPGCTDLAYTKAIADGVDVLDCPVQLTKDGTPVCLSSVDLTQSTTVAQSSFSNFRTTIPEIGDGPGIFTFKLTWSQIQTLTPAISNPFSNYKLYRNPKFKNAGKFLTLLDFLALSKNASSLTGVLISIEHAGYLEEKQGLKVGAAVSAALSKAGYDKQTSLKVMIQSSESSALMQFEQNKDYELVYKLNKNISDATDTAVKNIKEFANSVVINKESVYPETMAFSIGVTSTVSRLQSFKVPVYVETFSNEFVSQAWDFVSDGTVEINSHVNGAKVDGVITDFPKTAARYKRNRCLGLGNKTPPYMQPVQPGSLIQIMSEAYLPPAAAPSPILTVGDH
ncbi:putative glycerophosphoryl diester phosphodiesterase 1 [Morella rubra]|uniref:glycerophosphodiester phosphodiesterase n=1 Tax=Morella rubra TaxID=262757 RepID=A0A6A1WI82_9ROSI|nr:putative glycerophosphoryl diester phosphodiesterase 1 [Morella rubra]